MSPTRDRRRRLPIVMGGHIDMLMDSVPTSLPQIEAGKTRALAVTSGVRNKRLPNVPTMMEAGIPNYDTAAWGSLMVPAGTPPDIVKRLSLAVQEAYKKPQVQTSFCRSRRRSRRIDAGTIEHADPARYRALGAGGQGGECDTQLNRHSR